MTETAESLGLCNACLSEKVEKHCNKSNQHCPWLICQSCKATSGPDGKYFIKGVKRA